MKNIFDIYKKFYETCFTFSLTGWPEAWSNNVQEPTLNSQEISNEVKDSTEAQEVKAETQEQLSSLKQELETSSYDKLLTVEKELDTLRIDFSTLQRGAKGKHVVALQKIIVWLGIHDISFGSEKYPDGIDGSYGRKMAEAVSKIQKSLNIRENGVFDANTRAELSKLVSSEIRTKSESRKNNEPKITAEVRNETTKIKSVVVEEKVIAEDYSTKEQTVKWWKEEFLNIGVDKLSKADIMSSVNKNSLTNVLLESNLASLTSDIKSALWTNDLRTFEYEDWLIYRNYSDAIPLLEKAGYITDGRLGYIEALGVIGTINGVYETQKIIPELSSQDKIKIVLDYDTNGVIDEDIHFYTKERDMLSIVTNDTEFDNLLKNLGYANGIQDFNKQFSENYFGARRQFKENIGTILAQDFPINPGYLVQNPEAYSDHLQFLEAVTHEIVKHPKMSELKDLDEGLFDKVKLQAVGLALWANPGAGVAFDVQEVTNNIVDSLQFGVIGGVPGIGISKNVYQNENGRVRADLWAINFIPYVSASGRVHEHGADNLKEIFSEEMSTGVDVTIWGAFSTMSAIWIDFSSVSEETSTGIERMKNSMSSMLDGLFEGIQNGQTFESLEIDDTAYNRLMFNSLESLLTSSGNTEFAIAKMKEWALRNYEAMLYANAEGTKAIGLSIGVIFAHGFLPLPAVWVHGEHISTDWYNEVNTSGQKSMYEMQNKEIDVLNVEDDKVSTMLSNVDEAISFKTRYNKGALQLLSPTSTGSEKWEWLRRISQNTKALRESDLPELISYAEQNGDTKMQWLILSSVIQQIKKSGDYNNGDMDKWNSETDKLISIDQKRRKWFNELFGFDATQEAKSYYEALSSEKGNIWEVTISGMAFDASATLAVEGSNKSVKGVEALYGNLQMLAVDGKPLLVEISDQAKIEAFTNTVKDLPILEEAKTLLLQGLKDGTVSLHFYKDPDGFDDRIVPMGLENVATNAYDSSKLIPVYQPSYQAVKFGVTYAGEKESNKNNEAEDGSEPGVGGGPDDGSEPGVGGGETPDDTGTTDTI